MMRMNEMNGMNEMTAMNEKLKWMKSKTMQDCHIETHVKISQEPLHTEIYMKNAQNADTHFARACAVETHVKILYATLYTKTYR